MKNLKNLFFVLLFSSIVLTGCQEAEEILDVKFNANYETELDIVVPSGTKSTNGTFEVNEIIDPTTNSKYLEYIDKIKDVKINELSGMVLSINKNVTLESTEISIYNESHNASWVFTNEPITVGTVLTLDNTSGQWDAMENIMLDKKVFTVSAIGQTDEDDVEFTILFTLKSEVTANPLD